MTARHTSFFSPVLNQSLDVMMYGQGGMPCLVFPSQNGKAGDYAGFGMVEVMRPWLDTGKLRLYCVDSLDEQTWSAYHQPPRERMERQEAWIRHLTQEFVPFIKRDSGFEGRLMTTGCSMGAFHAANIIFRFPDIFGTAVALSGAFDASWLMYQYMDDLVYLNSPVHSIAGMPAGHPFIARYNDSRIILCCGQGAWEEEMLRSLSLLEEAMIRRGIRAWVDRWGYDVNHDWDWWRRQLAYYLGILFP